MLTELQKTRSLYQPSLPAYFKNLTSLSFEERAPGVVFPEIASTFPLITPNKLLTLKEGKPFSSTALRIGVVFSGGPASGGHNVIAGLYDSLQKLYTQSALLGFLHGPKGIVEGKAIEITENLLAPYRNQGGFDFLGSGRFKIETEEDLAAALRTANQLKLDGIVIVGGDDSNTNTALLAEYFLKAGSLTKLIGVPKTIDGDLKNEQVELSFGFDTATKVYAELIGNLARDALSSRKYYHFVRLMGRSASHIALECALQTHPNLTLIGEEKRNLPEIIQEIAELVIQRKEKGKEWGVIVLPEGIVEFMPDVALLISELSSKGVTGLSAPSQTLWNHIPEKVKQQMLLSRDAHGNLNVSAIETETLLIEMVQGELKKKKFQGKFEPVPHFFGYEGRCGLPSTFDANYCYMLGFIATLLVARGYTGYMAAVSHLAHPLEKWEAGAVPLAPLMHFEMRKGKRKAVIEKALVDLKGKPYLTYKKQASSWKLEDDYRSPGPLQFFGPAEITAQPPLILCT